MDFDAKEHSTCLILGSLSWCNATVADIRCIAKNKPIFPHAGNVLETICSNMREH